MINFQYLLLEAFSKNIISADKKPKDIANYLKNLKKYKNYLGIKQQPLKDKERQDKKRK